MTEENKKAKSKLFTVISISKDDLSFWFRARYLKAPAKVKRYLKIVDGLSDSDMKRLTTKMADDYTDHMFWSSVECIFEELFV